MPNKKRIPIDENLWGFLVENGGKIRNLRMTFNFIRTEGAGFVKLIYKVFTNAAIV